MVSWRDLAYVNVHLEYGLKGPGLDANPPDGFFDRYDQGSPDGYGGFDALEDNATEDGPISIASCTDYTFEHTDGATPPFTDTVQNLNVFKRIKGVYGSVMSSDTGEGVAGAALDLYLASTGELVDVAVTDEDGFYAMPFKHTGPADLYEVNLQDPVPMWQGASLKANSWAQVEFDVFTGTSSAVVSLQGNSKAADFDASPVSGTKPLVVDFTDTSLGSGITSWSWDFGDGNTSTLQHPTHTYQTVGTYSVSLTVSGAGPSDTYVAHDLIEVTSGGGLACGLGIELALLLPVLAGLRRRRVGIRVS